MIQKSTKENRKTQQREDKCKNNSNKENKKENHKVKITKSEHLNMEEYILSSLEGERSKRKQRKRDKEGEHRNKIIPSQSPLKRL